LASVRTSIDPPGPLHARIPIAPYRETDDIHVSLVALLLLCGFRISEALAVTPVEITPRERGAAVAIKRKGQDAKTVFPIDDDWL
jgi:integrase